MRHKPLGAENRIKEVRHNFEPLKGGRNDHRFESLISTLFFLGINMEQQRLNKKQISIITPCFNEESTVQECYETIKNIFETQLAHYNYEHIFCDNASTDRTVEILRELSKHDLRVKVIVHSRNFGVFRSMFNGLTASSGDGVIPFVPADLQDPPELIPQFIEQWTQGFDIVYGVRSDREESAVLHMMRKIYYRLVNQLASIDIPLNVGEFTLIDRKVVEVLKEYEDYYPYVRGMIASCGFRSTSISYVWRARKRGLSKANAYALIDQGLNGLISFTNIPMRICMLFGFGIAFLSIFYSFFSFVISLIWFRQLAAPGIQTLIVAVFFFSGVILFALGIMGEYICAIHFQVRKRPLVVESERINF